MQYLIGVLLGFGFFGLFLAIQMGFILFKFVIHQRKQKRMIKEKYLQVGNHNKIRWCKRKKGNIRINLKKWKVI